MRRRIVAGLAALGVVVAGVAVYVATRDGVVANIVDIPNATVQLDPKIKLTGPDPEPLGNARARGSVLLDGTAGTDGETFVVRVQERLHASHRKWKTIQSEPVEAGGRLFFDGWTGMDYRAVVQSPEGRTTSAVERNEWTARFTDEFDGDTLDLTKWGTRPHAEDFSDSSLDAVEVGDGVATLTTVEDPAYDNCPAPRGQDCRVLSASIGTRFGSEPFTIAPTAESPVVWIAARVKFHEDQGAHSAFWTQSGYQKGQAEMDVAEWFGLGSNEYLWSNVYATKGVDHEEANCAYLCERIRTPMSYLPPGETWYNTYHVFALRWTAGSYHVYIDGDVIGLIDEEVGVAPTELVLSQLVNDWENQLLDWSDPTMAKYQTKVDWVVAWN